MKIGIPTSAGKTQYVINQAYIKYVAEAGLTPIIITPEIPDKVVFEMIEGLLLPGGIDLDPIYYGEDNTSSFGADPEKDAFERKLFHMSRERGIPVFGICRGFQLIAREYMLADGKMSEYLYFCEHIGEHNQVDNQQLSRNIHQHFVEYAPETLYGIKPAKVGPYHTPVNSMHHQCLIADFKQKHILGMHAFRMAAWTQRGLKASKNKASTEVVCEAFRILNWGSPILAVQWHPEELRDLALLQNFFIKGGVRAQHLQAP